MHCIFSRKNIATSNLCDMGEYLHFKWFSVERLLFILIHICNLRAAAVKRRMVLINSAGTNNTAAIFQSSWFTELPENYREKCHNKGSKFWYYLFVETTIKFIKWRPRPFKMTYKTSWQPCILFSGVQNRAKNFQTDMDEAFHNEVLECIGDRRTRNLSDPINFLPSRTNGSHIVASSIIIRMGTVVMRTAAPANPLPFSFHPTPNPVSVTNAYHLLTVEWQSPGAFAGSLRRNWPPHLSAISKMDVITTSNQ